MTGCNILYDGISAGQSPIAIDLNVSYLPVIVQAVASNSEKIKWNFNDLAKRRDNGEA